MFKRAIYLVAAVSLVGAMLPNMVFASTGVANELGRVPILEYHQIGPKEDRWTRSFDHFRADLEWLYHNDYRAVSINDFMNQKIALPYGKKPVVFTFDDGGYTQLNFKDGAVDPYTAIGIMDDFLKVHPDFGSAAVFYLNANPFKLVSDKKKAIDYLLSTGRQIGNHTLTHANLAKVNAQTADAEMGKLDTYVRGLGFPDIDLTTLAYPFGGVPKGESLNVVKKYVKLALLVGAEPAVMSYSVKYDAYHVPRIQAIDDEWKRWFKRTGSGTEKSSQAPIFVPFVSDGDVNTVTVPSENGLNRAAVRSGVKVVIGSGSGSVPAKNEVGGVAAGTTVQPSMSKKASLFDQLQRELFGFRASVESDATQEMSVVVPVVPVVSAVKKPTEKKAVVKPAAAKKETKSAEKPAVAVAPPTLYYQACGDPEADMYINYKLTGMFAQPTAKSSSLVDWNQVVAFPGAVAKWVRSTTHPNAIRGIYYTGSTAAGETGKKLTEKLLAAGGNAVVFDLDESSGALEYGKGTGKPILRDFKAFVAELNSKHIYTIARIVSFKDKIVTRTRPDLAIQSAGGGMWRDNKGAVWMDASNPDTVQYVIDMAKEAAAMGVDEVQFDYVRFPTEGNLGAARFKFDSNKKQKWEVIRDFMKEARKQTMSSGVKLGADIFGIVGWQHGYDAKTTGQKIECIAPYLDVIYPMGYPSHFGPGFGGHKNPADEPYYFTWKTAQQFADYATGTGAAIRPWLQSFTYRVTIPYNSSYISEQMRGTFAAGGDGFVLWNASNTYDIAWPAIGK